MDQIIKKTVLRQLSYGVYILTVKNQNAYVASKITWLSQASFNPPLIMMGINKESKIYLNLLAAKKFAINIVGEFQKEMAASFFKDTKYQENTINRYEFKIVQTGAPILINALSYIECTLKQIVESGDHNIVIGEIINTGINNKNNPLSLHSTGWNYGG